MIALRKPMRLCLSIPPAFSHVWSRDQDGRYTAASPGGQITIACGALQPLPDDLSAWRSSVLAANMRSSAELELGGVVDRRSETGWRFRVADARVLESGVQVEVRMAAFFRFFEHVGAALVTIPGATAHPDRTREAIKIFTTARPDFSSHVAAVHQLWPS